MREVFEQICRKRKYDSRNYVLKMADTKTDVPLDRTLASLGVTEFCVLKRGGGGGKLNGLFKCRFLIILLNNHSAPTLAGDIFLRPPDENTYGTLIDQPRFVSEEFTSVYKVKIHL